MHDVGYVAAGYAATAAGMAWYRWRLARRAVRARRLVAALTGRPDRTGRPRR